MTKNDEFDPSTARIISNNKDDEFDPSTAKLSSDTHDPNSRSWGTALSDFGNSMASGAAAAGRGILGLSDLVTGSNSIQNTKNLGLDIKSSEQAWKDNLSEKAKQEEQAWNNTQGFVDTLKYGATHPFAVANKVAESLPAMAVSGGMGGAVAKGVIGGAVGEGMQQAGSSYADAIEKNNGNTPTDKDAGAALGSGVTTGTISALSGGLAKKLGIGDIDTAIANRVAGEAATSARPLGLGAYAKNIGKGIVTEGALEELPQSATEQMWQNYPDGNPIMEGVPEAAAQGLITGGLMGGAFNATNLPTFSESQSQPNNTTNATPYSQSGAAEVIDPNTPQLEYTPPQPPQGIPYAPASDTFNVSPDGVVFGDENINEYLQGKQAQDEAMRKAGMPSDINDITPVPTDAKGFNADILNALPAPTNNFTVDGNGNVLTTADLNSQLEKQRQADIERRNRIASGLPNDATAIPQEPTGFGVEDKATPALPYKNDIMVDSQGNAYAGDQINGLIQSERQQNIENLANSLQSKGVNDVTPVPSEAQGFINDTRTPAEKIGLDQNQGGLSSAAAVAVDTGASPITAELQRQATQSQPNEQANWLNGIASPADQNQNEAPQLGYSPSENTNTPPAQQAQVADLWNNQDPQQRMAILGGIYGNEDMARQNALASFDRLPKPAQQQIADIAVQNGAVSEDNNTQSSNGQTTQTAPQAPLTALAQDIAPDSQANAAPAIEPILGKDGKNKWFATQNKADEFIQKKSLGDNYTIEQTGKMRYEIVPKVQPQTEQTAQPNTESSSKADDQWLSNFTNQMLQDKQLSSQLSNPSNSDELTFSEFSRKFDENLAKNFTNSTDNANEQILLQNKNDNEIAKQQAYQLAKAQINQNQQQPTQANDASSQQNNNVFESAGTPKNREGLLLDYQTHSDAIDKDIESRGLTEQLHSIAGATTERPFSEMSKEKQAKAYADLVESGAKPAHIMETSDEQAARLEQSAEMRRLQSTDTITQKNGKPFKQQQAAEKIIQENNLRFTHEVKQVDDGFILKQLSPAAQQEAKNKADGIESYTDIQSRVAKDMGIGTNEYGEYDVSDEQFAEMNKRVDAIQREQRGLKPIQDGGNATASQPKLYGKESYIQTGSERQPTRVAVVEADSLAPDDKNTDNQFRDRTRSASQTQIDSIANNLDPRQLTDSTTMATGSPTLANDGKTIIAGNGRTKAIKQAYAQGKGAEYKQSLIEQAQSLGIDPQQIAGMKNPVLVKEFANPVDVKKMAIESNATGGLAMSAKEQARADSALMPDMSMLVSDDKGNINLSRNAHIFRKFISSLPVEAQASMLDKDGLLSKEGLSRLQNAVLYKAYGDSKAFDDMVENTDVDVKNAINGLTQVAPKIAQTKESINKGTSYDADISDDITAALSLLQQIRKNEMSVSDYLSQMGLFDDGLSPIAKEFIQYIDDNIRSAKAIADLLSAYYDNLDKLGNPNQQDLLGGKPNTDKQSLFKQALEQVRNAKQPKQTTNDLFAEPTASDAGQPTNQADNAVEQRPNQSEGDGAGVGTNESAKPSDEQVKTALKELVSDDVWGGKKALIISPSFAQKIADQLGYQGDIQNKADGTMSDFAKQVNDVYGGMIKNQAKPSNQKAKDTPQPSKTEVYADELEKWVANTKSAAEFARSVTGLRDSQLPNGVNVDFYNFIAQAIGAKSPQTIGFRIKLEEYWQQKNTQPTNVKEGIAKTRAKKQGKKTADENIAETINATINELDIKPNSRDSRSIIHSAIDKILGKKVGVKIKSELSDILNINRMNELNPISAENLSDLSDKELKDNRDRLFLRANALGKIIGDIKGKPIEQYVTANIDNNLDLYQDQLSKYDKEIARRKDGAFDPNNDDIRYSQMGEYTPDLIVTHNLTADAIIHADKIGGLPFASIAITKQDNPLTGFGEVTLIGDKNLIDPKGVNKAKVFGSDIYSPRYPRVVVKADSKKLAQFNKDLEPARQVIESSQQISEEDFAGKYNVLNDSLVKLHFLQQNGINIERKYREVEEEVSGNKDQIDSAKADVKSLEQFADAFGVDSVEQYLAQATDSEIYTKVQEIGENNPDAFDAIFKTLADAKVERSPFKTRVRMLMDNIRMSRGKTGNYLIGSLQSMAGVVSGRTQLAEDGVRKKQVFDYSDTINQIDKALTDNNLEQAFNDYIDNVRSDLVIDERLDNGVTSTGARRTVAHTIENVIKKLKKDLRGGESFNYGLPSVRAKVTPQFKTVQQIQESKDKIITSEQFDLIKKEIDDEMSDLSDKLGLESYLDIGDFLADVIDNGADKAFDFFNVKNSVPNKKLVADFLAKLKDMPTTYFEVKAKEVTQFSDFTGAVVPNSISHKARNILEQAGLKLYTYGSNVGIERADAIKQATTELNNTNGNILFSQANDTESKLRSELQSLMAMQKQASQGLSLTERANSKQLREIIRRIDETKSELQKVLDKKSQPMQSNSGKENLIVSEYTGSRTVYHGTKAAVADEIMQNGIKFGTQLNDGDYRGGGYGVIQNSTSASLDPNVSKNFSNDAKPSIVKIQLADDAKIITIENEMYAEDLEDYADELKGVDAVYLANNGEQEIVILNKDKVKVVESRGFSIRDAIPRFSVLNRGQVQNQSQALNNQANRTKSNQAAVQNITKTLSDKFGKAAIDKLIADGNLEIIDYAEAKRRNPKTPSNADGYYADGKAVLIADNLSPDMIIPTFLHELGGHGGLQTLMSDKAYQSLMKEFDRMVAEGNQLAKDAKAFADATSPNAKVAQDEYLPYLISLAAKAQGNSKVKSMLNRIVMAVKSFMRDKFGVSFKITPADIVALAEKMVSERAMQIKPATNNNGAFDSNNNDIRYSQMGGSQAQQNKLRKALAEFFKNPLSFAKTVADNKYTDNLGKALALLGRRQLVDIYKKDLPPIKEYSDIVEQMDADSNEKAYEADKLVKEWGKLKDELPLAELMHDATLKGIDPAEAYQAGDDRAIYQQLRRRYDALSPDAKRIYKQARDDYKAQQRSVFEAIKGRIQRTDMSAPRQAELIRKMEQGFFFGQKVYFPLARFGNYVVAVKDAAGDIISVSRAETKGQADELRKELIAQYPNDKVGRVMLDKEFVSSRDGVTRGFMSDLFDAADKLNISSQERAEFEDTLGQLYLNSLPDISFAKSGMHRKGTPGFSQNARRAYAQHMSRGSHYIAKMRHSDVLQAKLDEMQEYVKAQGEADPNYDQPKMQRVVDEMEKRHELLMNTAHSTLSTLATSVGFMWYMGLSPASAIVNLSQTALVAYPIMGAKWGFDKAGKELLIASKQAAKALNDIQSILTTDEKKAVEAAISSGVIDKTQAHDLAGVARGEDDSVMWKIRKPMEWASFMFHHAEKFNRQVTFVASYRLARQAGFDTKSAILQARDMTWDTQYNYEQSNRPRIMQGNWQRVIFLFKQYGQNMTYTLLRNAYLAAKGDKQALRTLAGMLVMHGTFAGILGLPLVSTLLSAASMLGGDDDEPWDAEIALRNYLAELLGDDASEVISKGLPRALGIDLSSRVGLDSLILPRIQEGLEGQRAGENTLAAFAGPVFGIGVNAMAGISDIQNGNTLIGTEKLLPKAVRDLVKTYRYATEGIIDKTGVEIMPQENISLSDVGQQALGFRSGKIAQAQEGKSAIYKMDKEIGSKRQRLMNRYAKAYMAGDIAAADEAWQDIKRFNAGIGKDYPKLKITKPKLMQSIKQRRRRIEDAEDGIYLPSSREASRQYGSFATE